MPNTKNLTSWQPGQSGNPAGKPKGTKQLSSWIREMMEDENFTVNVKGKKLGEAPVKAIINTLIIKAINGDLKAIDLLAKYGYGSKFDLTSQNEKLPTPIIALETYK